MYISASRQRMAGISMVELILFIIVVSIGVVGILPAYNIAVKGSSDPVLRKQSIAIAESLLAEIEQQNFTYCDPQESDGCETGRPRHNARRAGRMRRWRGAPNHPG